ncbi:MAG: TonB family protein [Ignavibacteriales bacterium]|nr:TonB family protein [Ignavibacteriales bacterium]
MIHFLLIGGVQLYLNITDTPDKKITIRIIRDVLLNPPPLISGQTIPQVSVTASSHVSEGVPIPVPDAEINPEATIPTQDQMNQPIIGSDTGDPNGTVYIPATTFVDQETPPESFTPVEKQPVPVSHPSPIYPEIARRAGVEGTVWVNMWVTKEGKVKQAVAIKSSADILNQAAIDAAVQWTFTPAIMNNGPVAVWVSVPFRFQLNAK